MHCFSLHYPVEQGLNVTGQLQLALDWFIKDGKKNGVKGQFAYIKEPISRPFSGIWYHSFNWTCRFYCFQSETYCRRQTDDKNSTQQLYSLPIKRLNGKTFKLRKWNLWPFILRISLTAKKYSRSILSNSSSPTRWRVCMSVGWKHITEQNWLAGTDVFRVRRERWRAHEPHTCAPTWFPLGTGHWWPGSWRCGGSGGGGWRCWFQGT